MATTAGRQGLRSLASRAVHIEVRPAPRNIRESRHVLRLLKDFGPVSMFKNLGVRLQIIACGNHEEFVLIWPVA